MISETNFARGYSSFWIEYFPWLNSYCQSINKYKLTQVTAPLPEIDAPEHRSINNTIAFFHFRNLYSSPDFSLDESRDKAVLYIARFPRNSLDTYGFGANDRKIVEAQVCNLTTRYRTNITFSPFFPGCGILDNCCGDILQGKKLVEIKAGDRNIMPSDLKQLIVYTALNWISLSPKYEFDTIEIFNPRVGYCWNVLLDDLLISITDTPKEDIFEQLAKYLVVQSEDVEIR